MIRVGVGDGETAVRLLRERGARGERRRDEAHEVGKRLALRPRARERFGGREPRVRYQRGDQRGDDRVGILCLEMFAEMFAEARLRGFGAGDEQLQPRRRQNRRARDGADGLVVTL